jgi:ABC-type antimicrobial peptide transport system permease subunit
MLLGADAYGRDNFSRLLYGGRATLAVAFIATLAAACLGMLLPAARGYVLTQASLLLPAFILAEATMSYVGLGFQGDVATWGDDAPRCVECGFAWRCPVDAGAGRADLSGDARRQRRRSHQVAWVAWVAWVAQSRWRAPSRVTRRRR